MLLYSTILLSVLLPVMTILAYRQGIKDSTTVNLDASIKPIKTKPMPKAEKSDADKYWETVMHNINVYDGTGRGQIDVE